VVEEKSNTLTSTTELPAQNTINNKSSNYKMNIPPFKFGQCERGSLTIIN
jgi:hypothetical protein